MFKVSDKYKKEIDKLGGRSFVSKVIIRDKEYNDDNIKDMNLSESVNPSDNFSLGSVVSNTFEINLIDIDTSVIFEDAIVKPYIGLELENKIEYIPLGVFTVDNVTIKDKKVKLECMDNMIKLERAYFSDLKYPCNINEVLKEICKKANIKCNSILPNYAIDEIKGYSFRQSIGILATLSGCFARFNRVRELEILSYTDVGLKITPDTFFKFEKNDKDYIIGKITAKKGDKTFSKGSNTEIIIDNPVITEEITNDIYNKFKNFTYRPYTLSWQGNPAVQAGDRVTIVDLDGREYNTLIMEQKFTYNGGIKSELKASGKTESSDRFDSKGPVTQAMENYSIEQAAIKVALIKKADIDSLNAIDAKINNLYAQDLTVLNAKIRDLQSNKISTVEFNATRAEIQTALIGKADVNELNVAVEMVGILEGKTLSVENQLAGNLTAKNFKANSIVAGSGIIAEGAIGSAQISDLELNKLRSGDISTSKFRIISANGAIQIVGNQILINRDNINRVILGEYKKQNNTTDYGLLIRAKDGKTVMFDSDGVHNAGITDGAIDNNKVADNANISGNKLDINSVIREVNNKGTETIKGTKVTVGDRTLDVELSTQNNTITEHSKELLTQKASIQALDKAIKLKVDNQTFTQSTSTINKNINSLNSDLVNKINASLNNAKSYADSKKQEAINIAITNATNKANNALNSAKNFTTAQITTTNSNLSKATSEINILKEQINTKVGQADIDRSIANIEFGGRNLLKGTLNFDKWTASNSNVILIEEKFKGLTVSKAIGDWAYYYKDIDLIQGKTYTLSAYVKCSNNDMWTAFFGYKGSGEGRFDFPKASEWFRYRYTFTAPTSGTVRIRLETGGINGTGNALYVCGFKLVEGSKSSDDWTPAPEDTDQLIVDNIKVVTDKINDISTKLVQAKDSLQASVNSLNSTTQTITTNLTNTTNKIDNLKIGSRNYVRYSNFPDLVPGSSSIAHWDYWGDISVFGQQGNTYYNKNGVAYLGAVKGGGIWQEISSTFIKPNTEYTLSLLFGEESNVKHLYCWIEYWEENNTKIKADCIFNFSGYVSLERRSYIFRTINSEFKNIRLVFSHEGAPSANGYLIQIGLIQIEEGNINTDWKLAIEDTKNNILYAKQQAINSANSHADAIAISKSNEALNNAKTYTNTQITTVNTRVSNVESSINILKNQISTKVSQTDIDKSISNIKLGGRNLALETNPQSYSGFAGRINDCQMGYSILLNTLEVGDSVTVSYVFSYKDLIPVEGRNDFGIWLQGCGNVTEWGSGGFNGGDRLTSRINFGVGKKGEFRVEYTFKITSDMKKNKSWFSNFRMDFIKSGEVGVKFFKVEKGTKASDYTPAPEDTDKKIQDNIQIITEKITNVESSFTQKANSINAVVNSVQSILNTKADGSTVSNMQSQLASLNIGLDGVKTEVAKKTDKGSIISAINQSAEEIKIDASKIQINGITTFSDDTGLKAVEIDNNAVNLFNWAKNGSYIGSLISLILDNDRSKPIIAICNAVDSYTSICYKQKDKSGYGTYVSFDKYNVAKTRAIAPIKVYEDIEMHGKTIYNADFKADKIVEFTVGGKFIGYFNKDRLSVLGNLDVTGRKNRVVENTLYGDLMLNAVESTECWFTDTAIEQSRTDPNGDCIIWLDNKFLQTVNTRYRYKVDVTPLGEFASNGKLTYVRVVEKTEKYFKVRGTPNTLFDWTVTAKQKGYENERLEKKAS